MYFGMLLNFGIEWEIALTDSLASNALLAAATVLIVHTLRYYRPDKKKYVYLIVWCAVATALWAAMVRYGLGNFFEDNADYMAFLDKSMPVRFDIAFLVTGCSAIMSMMWYNLEEQKIRESRKSDAEKLARDAELYKLRQQLHPHFLFNSLNSISALAGRDPEQARKMIQYLSDFLRTALKKEDHQLVTLADELQHLQLYLEMEKMRFGHRLTTQTTHDEESLSFMIPPMLLQPIVENAIKFGLYDITGDITITITAETRGDHLHITVSNPFDPETSTPRTGTGFGLNSVQRRLYLLFSRNDLLKTQADNTIFSTTVKIPRHDHDRSDRR